MGQSGEVMEFLKVWEVQGDEGNLLGLVKFVSSGYSWSFISLITVA